MKRSRNGRCRHRERVHVVLEKFQPFLVFHAETLFFVENQKPEIFEFHVLVKERVSAYNKVDIPAYKPFNNTFRLFLSAESVERGNPYSKRRKPFHRRSVMLFAKYRRGADERDLFAVRNRLESRSERNLRFAESHVAAQKSVHNLVALHVGFYLGDGLKLVVGRLELEHIVELAREFVIP